MGNPRRDFPALVAGLYLFLVSVSLSLSLAFESVWVLILYGMTLPWSIFALGYIWAFARGDAAEFLVPLFLLLGGANSIIVYYVCVFVRRYRES